MKRDDLSWRTLTRRDIEWNSDEEKMSRAQRWLELHDRIRPLLDITRRFLELDLEQFKVQSGKDRLAILSPPRIKLPQSFTNKLIALGHQDARERLSDKFKEFGPTASIFELINDLVGARLVFYFERDIEDAVLYWMSYPTFVQKELVDWTEDLSGYDGEGVKWWRRALRPPPKEASGKATTGDSAQARQKASGYESLHFVLRFDLDLLRSRIDLAAADPRKADENTGRNPWKVLKEDLTASTENDRTFWDSLGYVHFEVQCRTILEHVWAEVEHRSNYAVKKASLATVTPDTTRRKFRSYKAILRSAQVFQNTLRSGFARWDEKRAFIVGRNTHCELGPRDKYWIGKDGHKEILELQKEFKKEKPGWEDLWTKTRCLFRHFEGGTDVSTRLSFDEYGRRRLPYLYLGFILGYCPQDHTEPSKAEECRKLVEGASDTFYTMQFGKGDTPQAHPASTAIRIYETIRLLDEHYASNAPESDRNLFRDPLPSTRAASVYYRHFGSFRRSTQLYEEALQMVKEAGTGNPFLDGSNLLTPHYIGKRIAENHWTAYHLDGHRPEDLCNARNRVREAYEALLKTPRPDLGVGMAASNIWTTLPSLLLTIELAFARQKLELFTTFGRSKEDLWRVARTVEASVSEYREPLNWTYGALVGQPNIDKKSLRVQGLAIWEALQAHPMDSAGSDGVAPNREKLNSARKHIRRARENIAEKVQRNAGGAIPFHEDSAREVEEFIYALSLEME